MRLLPGILPFLLLLVSCTRQPTTDPIDREALLARHCPVVEALDTLASLTVGNGDFAMTVDVTGLQTFPERYSLGVPLGTMSSWGWHSFDNPEHYCPDDCLVPYDFGTGSPEALYSQQVSKREAETHPRLAAAAHWLRSNPHRLHLGCLGLDISDSDSLTDIHQRLDLLTGTIGSQYRLNGRPCSVQTACHPQHDVIALRIVADTLLTLRLRIPGPTGQHSDDACDWVHVPTVTVSGQQVRVPYGYTIEVNSQQPLSLTQRAPNEVLITLPHNDRSTDADLIVRWQPQNLTTSQPDHLTTSQPDHLTASQVFADCSSHWQQFWHEGACVDFSRCTDPRAAELERRVVLSQYLLAVNSAGQTPPQETGLTYNSWFGKFHLEMIYWHQAWLPLWGHGDLLDRTLRWYQQPEPHAWARQIASRQGYRGLRWMKMTDPSGLEAPSKVGSFLIWQQPHPIYLAELLRRSARTAAEADSIVDRYYDLVMETAEWMADFAAYDAANGRYVLRGNIPAQETLRASEVINSPYELSEWHTVLPMAQHWRELRGEERIALWDSVVALLSPLAAADGAADHSPFNVDSTRRYGRVYLACETTLDTYTDRRLTSDHMAVLGALGIYPASRLINPETMDHTLSWVLDNWNWDKTWGWDYPMTAMCAARLGRPDDAVNILLNGERTNTYLPNGHNYQDARLRCYLPGNGGLLTAVALMSAGWDGCTLGPNPGWPRDGRWDVRWEGLHTLP